LDEDVAGATFMAAGSSAPEVFISLIGKENVLIDSEIKCFYSCLHKRCFCFNN
jgi:hypothetical protein